MAFSNDGIKNENEKLSKTTIGIIGGGNMGTAIIKGIVNGGLFTSGNLFLSDVSHESAERTASQYKINAVKSNNDAAKCDILLLCVKPNVLYNVISEISETVRENNTVVISIAAGQTIEKIENAFGFETLKLLRVMPNTPAMVGEGMSAIVPNGNVSSDEYSKAEDIFKCLGEVALVGEDKLDAITAVSGSSPAFVFMFIEAMADAAVKNGISRADAYRYVSQTVLGSAKMVLETGKHPGELKDMVCSPGGTTIEGVATLEKTGFRGSVMEAIDDTVKKSKNM